MMEDMENMLNEFDKIAKLDVFLHYLKFCMAVPNAQETFNGFLAKFNLAIAPLDFTDCHKISNLRKTLCELICFKILDGITYTALGQYVLRYRW